MNHNDILTRIGYDADKLELIGVIGTVRVYIGANPKHGTTVAIAINSRSKRPTFHYRFPAIENARAFATDRVMKLTQRAGELANYRQQRKEQQRVDLIEAKPGQIRYRTWGYEQTNVTFYQILTNNGKTVTYREVQSRITESSPRAMSGKAEPLELEGLVVADGPVKRSTKLPGYHVYERPVSCSWYG